MVKRGGKVVSPRNTSLVAPSHKEHHHRAVLFVGFTIIAILLILIMIYFIGPGKATGQAALPVPVGNQGGAANANAQDLDCAPVPEGLVAWWVGTTAPGNLPLELISGQRGEFFGNARSVEGLVDSAYQFGGGSYAEFPGNSEFFFDEQDFSVEGWLRTPDPLDGGILFDFVGNPLDRPRHVGYRARQFGGGQFAAYRPGSLTFMGADEGSLLGDNNDLPSLGQPLLYANTWHHFVFVRQGEVVMIYQDGAQVATARVAPIIPGHSEPYRLGASTGAVLSSFNGLLDELSLYNRALTPDEIITIVQAGSAGKCRVRESICNNGLDDDADLQIDCQDQDCRQNILTSLNRGSDYQITLGAQACEGSSVTLVTSVE